MSEKESGNTGAAESCLFCAIQTDDRKRIVEEKVLNSTAMMSLMI